MVTLYVENRKAKDKVAGYLEVGSNDRGEVVIQNIPPDTGHVVFSPNQARGLARLLLKHADVVEGKSVVTCPVCGRAVSRNGRFFRSHKIYEPPFGWCKGSGREFPEGGR